MTNDPSMTITSTAPAPEVGDSTNREGKTVPLPMAEGGNTPPAPDVSPALVELIDGTIYEVSFHFSTTSKETINDKISRLIRLELEKA